MYTIYVVYCGYNVMYVGRTKRGLTERLRGHFLSGSRNVLTKGLPVHKVSKVEYAECETESDMNLYEIYYILKLKPMMNHDDKAYDDLTLELPPLVFKNWDSPLLNKWKERDKV